MTVIPESILEYWYTGNGDRYVAFRYGTSDQIDDDNPNFNPDCDEGTKGKFNCQITNYNDITRKQLGSCRGA